MVRSLLQVSLLCVATLGGASACGGNVVFVEEDGAGGEGGGAGGFGSDTDCVLACGTECTKCIGNRCFTGQCSSEGECVPDAVLCP